MKISQLHIKDFNQFKEFELELTYPKGHKKAGEPLDKICIIGQSGTGKTTLLNLIYEHFEQLNNCINFNDNLQKNGDFDTQNYSHFFINKCSIEIDCFIPFTEILNLNGDVHQNDKNLFVNHKPFFNSELYSKFNNYKFKLFLISAELNFRDLYLFKQRENNKEEQVFVLKDSITKNTFQSINVSKLEAVDEMFWKKILKNVDDYDTAFSNFLKNEIVSKIKSNQKDIDKILNEFHENNADYRKNIFDKIEHILTKFGLILDESRIENYYFPLKNINEGKIENAVISTGTKQIISTSIPIIEVSKDAPIILFDEPERSLYPDIQAAIVQHYTNLSPDSQFIFATHSPIVAAQFEPWEIVELKFTESGTVTRKKYYEGENHVDNYVIDSRYYNYELMLKNVFDVKTQPNDEFRNSELSKLLFLQRKIKTINGDVSNKAKKENLIDEFNKIAKKLNWENIEL